MACSVCWVEASALSSVTSVRSCSLSEALTLFSVVVSAADNWLTVWAKAEVSDERVLVSCVTNPRVVVRSVWKSVCSWVTCPATALTALARVPASLEISALASEISVVSAESSAVTSAVTASISLARVVCSWVIVAFAAAMSVSTLAVRVLSCCANAFVCVVKKVDWVSS